MKVRYSAAKVAKKLNVNYMLDGSVRRQGYSVRINVQLIDARNDRQVSI
ncbi:MAG: hypothetical protein U5K79_02005 [Cyclobacteriaceae bacterium]|nr:hypothetical protein [Cyclobacteriaceae bacterium]